MLSEIFPALTGITKWQFTTLHIACPECMGLDRICPTCKGRRFVCPTCRGARWVCAHSVYEKWGKGKECPTCTFVSEVDPKTQAEKHEYDLNLEIAACEKWLADNPPTFAEDDTGYGQPLSAPAGAHESIPQEYEDL